MTADLHIHTTASDGRLSPESVLAEAIQAGLSHIAITDHDTVDGLLQLYEDEENIPSNIRVIPGIEFSTELPKNEIHILGYYIDIYNTQLRDQLKSLVANRHQRTKQMIIKLNQLGYAIDYLHVLQLAKQVTSIGRPHLAEALVQKGYFGTVSDAFNVLLDKSGPAYVPHYKMTPAQVIALIKAAGGIPVLAHPGLVGDDNIILDVINAGVLGLEVYHPTHNEIQIKTYLTLANQYQLAITGGSDFHAIPARFPQKLGMFTIPAELANKLKKISQYE